MALRILCLTFGRTTEDITGFYDSDYGVDLDNRKSISSYVFCLSGTTVSWEACLQEVTALSTTEAEYMAITDAFKEAKWLTGLV